MVLALMGAGLSAPAEESPPSLFTLISEEVREVFQRSQDAVVKISARDRHGELYGTGFFIDGYGTILTAYSVGGNTASLVVHAGNRRFPATRLAADPRSGIALLRVDATTPFLPRGDPSELQVASPVVAIGYPMDLDITPSFGLVAGFDLQYLGRYLTTSHIRANVPVQKGKAGSPLLNLKGEVVGILVSGIDGGSACYALPITAAEKIRRDFLLHGAPRHGWVGVTVEESDHPVGEHRAVVAELMEDTPAWQSGLRKGDILLRVGQTVVREPEDVINASFFLTAGDQVAIEVLREGREIQVEVEAILHPIVAKSASEQQEASPLALTREMILLRLQGARE